VPRGYPPYPVPVDKLPVRYRAHPVRRKVFPDPFAREFMDVRPRSRPLPTATGADIDQSAAKLPVIERRRAETRSPQTRPGTVGSVGSDTGCRARTACLRRDGCQLRRDACCEGHVERVAPPRIQVGQHQARQHQDRDSGHLQGRPQEAHGAYAGQLLVAPQPRRRPCRYDPL